MEGCVFRHHKMSFGRNLSARPIIINFRQLFQIKDAPAILPTVKNEDILRTVVALLDASQPDIGPRDIHETVHWHGVHTLILARDHADVSAEKNGKRPKARARFLWPATRKTTEIPDSIHNVFADLYSDSEDSQEESLEENKEEPAAEACSYRDGDTEEVEDMWRVRNEESEGWSWDRFQEGLQEFVKEARNRRERRNLERDKEEMPESAIGPESMIVAAACYNFIKLSTDTVLQLSLLAVRKRYRNLGIGRNIVKLLKHQSVVGKYDALVALARSNSVGFFKKQGLTDDIMLNEKFSELKDDWINSILMSYLPPFTTDLEMRNPNYYTNLEEMGMDLDLARQQALSSYQQQMTSVTRLIREVKNLQLELCNQREKVRRVYSKLEYERQARREIEQKFLVYKLKNTEKILDNIVMYSDARENVKHDEQAWRLDEPSY